MLHHHPTSRMPTSSTTCLAAHFPRRSPISLHPPHPFTPPAFLHTWTFDDLSRATAHMHTTLEGGFGSRTLERPCHDLYRPAIQNEHKTTFPPCPSLYSYTVLDLKSGRVIVRVQLTNISPAYMSWMISIRVLFARSKCTCDINACVGWLRVRCVCLTRPFQVLAMGA